jgi:prepilin-type processing-associated H-X9-DG protein/prepilin-type N-terminal cleavage/methylation domain-containing protein
MKRNAFTIIELIVAISIIAFLIAVILPVLQLSKQRAKSTLCGSNIKQLTFGLLQYECENKTFPYGFCSPTVISQKPPGGHAGYSSDRLGWWWLNFIDDYYKRTDEKSTIAKCPSKSLPDAKSQRNILLGNYGINNSICKSSDDRLNQTKEFIGVPLKINEIPKPAQTLLLVDSGYTMINWLYATNSPPFPLNNYPIEDTAYIPGLSVNKTRILLPFQERDAISGRHPNKSVNVGFADGHTNLKKAEDLIVEKKDGEYKNRIPLWSPK